MSSVLTPRSHPNDIMTPPGAPKKPIVPTLYRTDSYDVEDFLAEVSSYHPADAIITPGSDDTEDTASSSRVNYVRRIIKSLTKCFRG